MAALIQEQNLNIILFPYFNQFLISPLVGLDRLPLFVKLARVISSPFINQVYIKTSALMQAVSHLTLLTISFFS